MLAGGGERADLMGNPKTATCCIAEAAFADFVLGHASIERAAEIERHVDACAACRKLLAEVAQALQGAGDSVAAPGEQLSRRALSRDETESAGTRASSASWASSLPLGERFGRYEIEALIGKGGMGQVYRARDSRLGRHLALKVMLLDHPGPDRATRVARLQREARAAAAIDHPNAVAIYDVDDVDGVPFIAMELVSGHPLRKLIHDAGIGRGTRVRWLIEIAGALGAAHERRIVHRDIKPENVMITRDGRVKVLDFGIARRVTAASDPDLPTLTETGMTPGTPHYMAPEQLRAQPLDGRADQFSWGVLAYELLARRRPWVGDPIAILHQISNEPPPPLDAPERDVPAELAAIVLRAMAKRPADRYPSMDEVAAALEPFAAAPRGARTATHRGGPLLAAVAAPEQHSVSTVEDAERASTNAAASAAVDNGMPGRARARRRAPAMAALAAVTLAGLAGVLTYYRSGSPAEPAPAEPASAEPVRIDAIGCSEAKLVGDGASPELARAIGVGACARLAMEVGVAWGSDLPAPKLDVASTLAPDGAEVTLSVVGRSASARAKTPLDAISAAVSQLGRELSPPPTSPEQVSDWGAKDGAGARRIERVFHRMLFNMDTRAETERLMKTDPESPWTWMLAATDTPLGSAELQRFIPKILDRVSAQPSARSRSVSGQVLCRVGSPDERMEARRSLEQSYAERPDDVVIASNYIDCLLINACPETAFAIVDRLWDRLGAKSLPAILQALSTQEESGYWDVDWNQRQVDRLHAIVPESLAWSQSIVQMIYKGQIDAARGALKLAQQLGYGGLTVDDMFKLLPAKVELAALDPGAARAMASRLLGDPRQPVLAGAAAVILCSYLMEGRLADAFSIAVRESERFRRLDNTLIAAEFAAFAASQRRWLGKPPPPPPELEVLERELTSINLNLIAVYLVGELGIARDRSGSAAARSTLAALEGIVESAHDSDRTARESMLVMALRLVRAVRGDQEASKLWRRLDRATPQSRAMMAFDAGLVLEAVGDAAGAEEAYRLALGAATTLWATFQPVAAHLRLARLYRGRGRVGEAEQLEAVVDRLWAKADPGLREAVLRLR